MIIISPEAVTAIISVVFAVFGGGWVWVNRNITSLREELKNSLKEKVDRGVCNALHKSTTQDISDLSRKFWGHSHDEEGNVIIPKG